MCCNLFNLYCNTLNIEIESHTHFYFQNFLFSFGRFTHHFFFVSLFYHIPSFMVKVLYVDSKRQRSRSLCSLFINLFFFPFLYNIKYLLLDLEKFWPFFGVKKFTFCFFLIFVRISLYLEYWHSVIISGVDCLIKRGYEQEGHISVLIEHFFRNKIQRRNFFNRVCTRKILFV